MRAEPDVDAVRKRDNMNKEGDLLKGSPLFFWLVFWSLFLNGSILADNFVPDFLSSFIQNYGCSSNARDTRDYHPFILERTRDSFINLEDHIRNAGFTVVGRIVVCGYQQAAIPSYFTHGLYGLIDDEVSLKTSAGWNFAQGNLFGFATGFLLKEVHPVAQQKGAIFEHITPERIDLFDDRAIIFQQHAFGDAFDLFAQLRKPLYKKIAGGDCHGVLSVLQALWQHLYDNQIRDGAHALLATQDSLFSIYYAQYLKESTIPIQKFFVGPDITYPIELLPCQSVTATEAAQRCVRLMRHQLQAVEGKKTAYVFCSFVDGVGKSTLLGNLKNFLRVADRYDQYERVDNSSSQRATLFSVSEDVVIVDLPAQVSHHLPKPDGSVFVDIRTVKKYTAESIEQVQSYFYAHKNCLLNQFKDCLEDLRKGRITWLATDDPLELYAKNCYLFSKDIPDWIPFFYNGDCFLINEHSQEVRVLVSFDQVHSIGLKVIQPEQMIFNKGISVPMRYEDFLQDLTHQMQNAGIEQVVFVDFMSMYPRTSRENIRVNFLLQQLRYHFPDLFSVQTSFYQHFINAYDVYLLYKNSGAQLMQGFILDAAVRCALPLIISDAQRKGITSMPLPMVSQALYDQAMQLYLHHHEYMHDLIMQKIMGEYETLVHQCAFDKECEALVQFDFDPLVRLSSFLQRLFTKQVYNNPLNQCWSGLDSPLEQIVSTTAGVLRNGLLVEVLGVYESSCRDKIQLNRLCSLIRAHWYASLSCLLECQIDGTGCFASDADLIKAAPLMIKKHGTQIYVLRKRLEEGPRFDGPCIATDQGAYAFGYRSDGMGVDEVTNCVRHYLACYHAQGRTQVFVPTSLVWDSIKEELKPGDNRIAQSKPVDMHAARLLVRALATVDMLIKDPHADIMIRRDHRGDFIAGVCLLEHITLPHCFKRSLNGALFDRYEEIEPVI